MVARVADEREQRRGLVLGLTLAEVLLLLLFLLLLALAAKLQRLRSEVEEANVRSSQLSVSLEQLKPLQQSLLAAGAVDITGVQSLAARFQRLQAMESETARLKEVNANLKQASELAKSLGLDSSAKLKDMMAATSRASQLDPNDPPALLKRAIDVLDKLGKATAPEDVRPLSEMKAALEAASKISSLEAEKDKLQRNVSNLMRTGNGLTYPSCWTKASGQTEYIFDITFLDTGITVRDATPERSRDPAWTMVASFPRQKVIQEKAFMDATSRLFAWSKDQNCRFYTINRDATGPMKQRYVRLRQTIESSFYPLYLRPQNANTASPVAPPEPKSE